MASQTKPKAARASRTGKGSVKSVQSVKSVVPKEPVQSVRSVVPEGPGIVAGFVLPGLPHPLLVPDASPAYRRLRDAYEQVRKEIARIKPDLLLLYSTQWLSVIGHQVQAREKPQWVHVDQEWHELGSIPYTLRMDPAFSQAYVGHGERRGLEMRTVDYHGFPIDTGTVVALKLLTPRNEVPASVVSCNMYADRAETIVLGKAARDAVAATGKRAVAIAVTALSNRMHTDIVPFREDRIHSLKDDEWNRKYLEFLGAGRLEDASQLAREFASQANGDQKLKAIWWLSAVMGAHNRYEGKVFAYESVYGTGAALVGLTPTGKAAADKEFDEDDAEFYAGDRNVLAPAGGAGPTQLGTLTMEEGEKWSPRMPLPHAGPRGGSPLLQDAPAYAPPRPARNGAGPQDDRPHHGPLGVGARGVVETPAAPKPLANYAHARRVGDLLFLAGIGPRVPGTDAIPGGPVRDKKGKPLKYDVKAQARQVIANIEAILRDSGATLADVFDVQVFLIDMAKDFPLFNEVYNEAFGKFKPARTTVQVDALPGPIAVELKVTAQVRGAR